MSTSCSAGAQGRCTCSVTTCSRHGNCCQCVQYHMPKGHFPACFFSAEAERTLDRSLECLMKDRGL